MQGILGLLAAIIGDRFLKECYSPLGDLMDAMAITNSAINFILYCFMSKQFRKTFVETFHLERCVARLRAASGALRRCCARRGCCCKAADAESAVAKRHNDNGEGKNGLAALDEDAEKELGTSLLPLPDGKVEERCGPTALPNERSSDHCTSCRESRSESQLPWEAMQSFSIVRVCTRRMTRRRRRRVPPGRRGPSGRPR